MSDDDDIEKLLREIDGMTNPQPPATRPQSESAPVPAESGKGNGGTELAIAAVIGVVGLLLGFLPFLPGFWLGLGGFLGAYVALLISHRLR